MIFWKKWRTSSQLEKDLQEHLPMLERLVASYEHNPAIQQELMQEVVLAIWQSYPRFSGQSSLKTYFARIAQNRCISHVQKAVKVVDPLELAQLETNNTALDIQAQVGREQQYQQLLSRIRKLPLQQKQVISLFLEGLNYQQIADICGLTTSNVGVIINRCKPKLMG
ncbi:RNA polymerase sigma factor [Thalassotalea mangrovi]|uniref:RNA polymerase sigma factor n=1 Tax=Thalassotalea mangrovi TaxID=2572245 RepID=A0A4U1B7R9_9GAMM|nr:RNA polymerase sigma factor [Thalassotalea mangrovi]TKB46660.1 RNA polymerase sigma factor [Thalassotalea mangrovi]